ncbi:ATP-binding protein [Nocardia sp. NPDC052001]|uniref:sensor histidine kinase n=1 Tax=Nocardia sp. NPDC052001 TaxID=3154853 RepID=UPI0034431527
MSESSNPGGSSNPRGGEPDTVDGARLPFGTLLGCAAVTAIAVGGTVFAAPDDMRIAVGIGGGIAAVLLCAAITAAAYFRSLAGRAGQVGDTRAGHAEARTAAVIAEAEARLADGQQRIQSLTEAVAAKTREAKESENRRAAAMAAFAGAAGRMQAMSTSMLAELREMEHRHADPKVLADLLELDHRTAQAGRLADSVAVLSGARSGRRWAKPIAMESILRGAMGRVAGYQRIRLRAVTDIAVAGHAAEGVMHALAELLDNACNFSPPTTEVHVYAAEVPAGVVITIEDSGLVMSESALRRAEATVSGKSNPSGLGNPGSNPAAAPGISDLSSLSGTRLGLAVVGYLARKHDLTVSYRPSAIGGTAVVVVVPRELTTRIDRTPGALSAIPLPARSPADLPPASPPRSDTIPALLTVDITTTAPPQAAPRPESPNADPNPTGPIPRRTEIHSGPTPDTLSGERAQPADSSAAEQGSTPAAAISSGAIGFAGPERGGQPAGRPGAPTPGAVPNPSRAPEPIANANAANRAPGQRTTVSNPGAPLPIPSGAAESAPVVRSGQHTGGPPVGSVAGQDRAATPWFRETAPGPDAERNKSNAASPHTDSVPAPAGSGVQPAGSGGQHPGPVGSGGYHPGAAPGFSGSTSVLPDRMFDSGDKSTAVKPSAPGGSAPAAPGSAAPRPSGLPRRVRGQTLAQVHPEGLAAPEAPPRGVARPVSPGALGAFQRAVNGRENAGTAIPFPSALESDK